MEQISHTRLKKLLNYDPETGVFTRLVDTGRGRFKAGTTSGCSNGRYREIWIDGGMKKIAAILLLALAAFGVAQAQTQYPQTFPPNTVLGRLGISAGPGQAIPFSILAVNLGQTGVPRTQRLVTSSPISAASTDQIINVNIPSGSPTFQLPLASTRGGVALSIKDVGGQFGAHSLTITPTSPDTIDGLTTLTAATNHQYLNFVPTNDGTTTGWSIQ